MICREYKKINELFNQVNDVAVEMCRGEGRGGGGRAGPHRTAPRIAAAGTARRQTDGANVGRMEKGLLFTLMLFIFFYCYRYKTADLPLPSAGL